MTDAGDKAYPAGDSWLDIVVPPTGELTVWLSSEAELPADFLDRLRELGLELELKHTSLCG